MSTQGGGAIVGLAIGCVALPAVLAVGAVVVAGRATVLAAKGAVHVGKALNSAYKEHEKKVEKRLAKEEATSERLAGLHRALSATEQQLEKCSRNKQSEDWDHVEFQRHRARELSRRRKKLEQEKEAAAGLQRELEQTVAKLELMNDQLPTGTEREAHEQDLEQLIEQRTRKLNEQSSDIAERLEEYRDIGQRVEEESRGRLLSEARELLKTLSTRDELSSSLKNLEDNGSLEECESFLRDVYAARRQSAGQGIADDGVELSRQLAAARLMAENLRGIAVQERRALLSELDTADQDLDEERPRQVTARLKSIEKSLSKYAKRDLDEWVQQESDAEEVLRSAQVVLVAMEEDEGMMALLSEAGEAEKLSDLRSRLNSADAMFGIGSFESAKLTARSIGEDAESLRDDTLQMENERRLGAIASVIQEAMGQRGFEGTEITRNEEGQKIAGQRGDTDFWITVKNDGNFLFDLGKDGFSSQSECWDEINGLLEDLKALGIVLDVDLQEPTLDPGEGTEAEANTTRWRTDIREDTAQKNKLEERDSEQEDN